MSELNHNHDADPVETAEWLSSLEAVIGQAGHPRAAYLLDRLRNWAQRHGVDVPYAATTPYVNTIPVALLQVIWQTHFAPHPFPNVTAYHVTAQQLVAFVQTLRGVSTTYIDTRVIEYGQWFDDVDIRIILGSNAVKQ